MSHFLIIAVGAALGANARYYIGQWAGQRFDASFPIGTLIVNVSGSFLLGFLLTLGTERLRMSPESRLLLTVGFLGSFTTFSSFAVESVNLLRGDGFWLGLLNIIGNNVLGVMCAIIGVGAARLIR